MDRRTWLQLLSVLSATRASYAQQRGGQQQQPLRITKDQVKAGLALLGVDFQEDELDLMLRRVDGLLQGYEAIRKIEVPYGVEPAFAFHPGLSNRTPIKGPQRFETAIPKSA